MFSLLIIAAFIVLHFLLLACFLWWGARWVKAGKPYFSRALMVTLVNAVLGGVTVAAMLWLENSGGLTEVELLASLLGLFVGNVLFSCLIIAGMMGTTFSRAIGLWLITLVAGGIGFAAVKFALKPFVLEAFVMPTNGMAPALIGWHRTGSCPHCQGTLIVPAQPPHEPERGINDRFGICAKCLQASQTSPDTSPVQSPVRIITNKLMQPRRWDMITFRYPGDPSEILCMRLVGLPSETVYIKDGAIWINEVKAVLPAALTGLQYVSEFDGGKPIDMGNQDNPWRLNSDQYCVLGDFSLNSADSRSWGPVPAANITGVITVSYWPMNRWKIHR